MKRNNKKQVEELVTNQDNIWAAMDLLCNHSIFHIVVYELDVVRNGRPRGNTPSIVEPNGTITLNANIKEIYSPGEWCYIAAHQYMHLVLGHFDAEKISGRNIPLDEQGVKLDTRAWNLACDLYVANYLKNLKVGQVPFSLDSFNVGDLDEKELYDILVNDDLNKIKLNTLETISSIVRMENIMPGKVYEKNCSNFYTGYFGKELSIAVREALSNENAVPVDCPVSREINRIREWFISSYPLLGAIAAGFKVIEDAKTCNKMKISIAAVNAEIGELYINPAAYLSEEELKFVIAHEFLHAGLLHHKRVEGRDPYLWNIACDYVINGWLVEMQVGKMPESVLYDKELSGMSAESVYDILLSDMRQNMKSMTFRGYGKGDFIFSNGLPSGGKSKHNTGGEIPMDMDEFCKKAMQQGWEYHTQKTRGYLPSGLVEEIKALGMPPIKWDVELAKWFDKYFPIEERHRTYAKPSRRQSATPDIPRPGIANRSNYDESRTFGVVMDTSGSMDDRELAMALGCIASYATSREVPFCRVVFCDAEATDAGYLSPDELSGRVYVTGRGGTVLQPGIDFLEKAKDFPPNGPILIITDGYIEDRLSVHRNHAYILSNGGRLPFKPSGEVFRMSQ